MLPDLEQSGPRARDPAQEKQVREAAEKAIKEIRTYGFEVQGREKFVWALHGCMHLM